MLSFIFSPTKKIGLASGACLLACFILYIVIKPDPADNIPIVEKPAVVELQNQTLANENTFVNTFVHFSIDKSEQLFFLHIQAANRLHALQEIAAGVDYELMLDPTLVSDSDSTLYEVLQLKIEGDFQSILNTLLGNMPYKFVKLQANDRANRPKAKMLMCIGTAACTHYQSSALLHTVAQSDTEDDYTPSQLYQQAIKTDYSPDSAVDLDARALTLKQEYRYANSAIKTEILQALDIDQELEFFIEALVFEENTQVRQAAARALFLSKEDRARSALLEALNDPDEMLVVAVLNILADSESADLRYEVSSLLANHPSAAVKRIVIELGF